MPVDPVRLVALEVAFYVQKVEKPISKTGGLEVKHARETDVTAFPMHQTIVELRIAPHQREIFIKIQFGHR